jgi:hypothetical protein
MPVLGLLAYYTSVRPYITVNLGTYASGFVDGALFISIIIIIAVWILSKVWMNVSIKVTPTR